MTVCWEMSSFSSAMTVCWETSSFLKRIFPIFPIHPENTQPCNQAIKLSWSFISYTWILKFWNWIWFENFHGAQKWVGAQISWGPRFVGVQMSWGPNESGALMSQWPKWVRGPNESGSQMSGAQMSQGPKWVRDLNESGTQMCPIPHMLINNAVLLNFQVHSDWVYNCRFWRTT